MMLRLLFAFALWCASVVPLTGVLGQGYAQSSGGVTCFQNGEQVPCPSYYGASPAGITATGQIQQVYADAYRNFSGTPIQYDLYFEDPVLNALATVKQTVNNAQNSVSYAQEIFNQIRNFGQNDGDMHIPRGYFNVERYETDFNELAANKSFRWFLRRAINWALSFVGISAILVIIVAGFYYIFSGLSDQKEKAKDAITYAIIGIVVILLSYAIVNSVLTAGTNQFLQNDTSADSLETELTGVGEILDPVPPMYGLAIAAVEASPGLVEVGGQYGDWWVSLDDARGGLRFAVPAALDAAGDSGGRSFWQTDDNGQPIQIAPQNSNCPTEVGNPCFILEKPFTAEGLYTIRVAIISPDPGKPPVIVQKRLFIGGVTVDIGTSTTELIANVTPLTVTATGRTPVGQMQSYRWAVYRKDPITNTFPATLGVDYLDGSPYLDPNPGAPGSLPFPAVQTFLNVQAYGAALADGLTYRGGPYDGERLALTTQEITFPQVGDYRIVLVGKTSFGVYALKHIEVRVANGYPYASFTVYPSTNPANPGELTFDATESLNIFGDREGLTYSWWISRLQYGELPQSPLSPNFTLNQGIIAGALNTINPALSDIYDDIDTFLTFNPGLSPGVTETDIVYGDVFEELLRDSYTALSPQPNIQQAVDVVRENKPILHYQFPRASADVTSSADAYPVMLQVTQTVGGEERRSNYAMNLGVVGLSTLSADFVNPVTFGLNALYTYQADAPTAQSYYWFIDFSDDGAYTGDIPDMAACQALYDPAQATDLSVTPPVYGHQEYNGSQAPLSMLHAGGPYDVILCVEDANGQFMAVHKLFYVTEGEPIAVPTIDIEEGELPGVFDLTWAEELLHTLGEILLPSALAQTSAPFGEPELCRTPEGAPVSCSLLAGTVTATRLDTISFDQRSITTANELFDASDPDLYVTWSVNGQVMSQEALNQFFAIDPSLGYIPRPLGTYAIKLEVIDTQNPDKRDDYQFLLQLTNKSPLLEATDVQIEQYNVASAAAEDWVQCGVQLSDAPTPPSEKQIRVTATATDDDGKIVRYKIEMRNLFGQTETTQVLDAAPDGSVVAYFDVSRYQGTHSFHFVITATDSDGATVITTVGLADPVQVCNEIDNTPPVASITALPGNFILAGATIDLYADANDEDGDVLTYQWVDPYGRPIEDGSQKLQYRLEWVDPLAVLEGRASAPASSPNNNFVNLFDGQMPPESCGPMVTEADLTQYDVQTVTQAELDALGEMLNTYEVCMRVFDGYAYTDWQTLTITVEPPAPDYIPTPLEVDCQVFTADDDGNVIPVTPGMEITTATWLTFEGTLLTEWTEQDELRELDLTPDDLSWSWNFGDGTGTTGRIATHRFYRGPDSAEEPPVLYIVGLTARSYDGRQVTTTCNDGDPFPIDGLPVVGVDDYTPELTVEIEALEPAVAGADPDTVPYVEGDVDTLFVFQAVPTLTFPPAYYELPADEQAAIADDYDLEDIRYYWRLGDGTSDYYEIIQHRYPREGEYIVTVEARLGPGLQLQAMSDRLRVKVAGPPELEYSPTLEAIITAPGDGSVYTTEELINFVGDATIDLPENFYEVYPDAPAFDIEDVEFFWSFGTGFQRTGKEVGYRYYNPSDPDPYDDVQQGYTVTLKARWVWLQGGIILEDMSTINLIIEEVPKEIPELSLTATASPTTLYEWEQVTFTATPTLTPNDIPGYSEDDIVLQWYFGDGATGGNFRQLNHTYREVQQDTQYIVKVVARVADLPPVEAYLTITVQDRVYDPDVFDVAINAAPTSILDGDYVNFSASVAYTAGNPEDQAAYSDDKVDYFWTFGDGGASGNQVTQHQYFVESMTPDQPAEYLVQLTARYRSPSGEYLVAHAAPVTITVAPLPDPNENFTVSITASQTALEPGDYVQFSSTVAYTADSADLQAAYDEGRLTYFWTFGDGGVSNEDNPLHQYRNEGQFLVNLRVRYRSDSGEELIADAQEILITVEAPEYDPDVFTVAITASPTAGESGLQVDFDATVTYTPGNAEHLESYTIEDVDFFWTFGDGGTSGFKTTNHQYFHTSLTPADVPEEFLVQLRAVYRAPTGLLEAIAVPVPITITDTLYPEDTLSVSFTASPTSVPDGSYVDFSAAATFTPGDPSCNATFNDAAVEWQWTLGDGGSSGRQTFNHVYRRTGNTLQDDENAEYYVTVRGRYRSPCSGAYLLAESEPQLITVTPLPEPNEDFTVSISADKTTVEPGGEGDYTDPNNLDGYVQLSSSVSYTADNTALQDDYNPALVAYQWTMGDGGASGQATPLYQYRRTGEFLVRLRVTYRSPTGELLVADSNALPIRVEDPEVDEDTLSVSFTASPTTVTEGDYVTFAGSAAFTPGDSECDVTVEDSDIEWFWTLGDGGSGNLPDLEHPYFRRGNTLAADQSVDYLVTLRGRYRSPCTGEYVTGLSEPQTITVEPLPPVNEDFTVRISADKTTVEPGGAGDPTDPNNEDGYVQFGSSVRYTADDDDTEDAYSEQALEYMWTFGDGGSSSRPEPLYQYRSVGTYQVTLRVKYRSETGQYLIADSNAIEVTVAEPDTDPDKLTVSFTATPTSIDEGEQVTFTATASFTPGDGACATPFNQADVEWLWTLGDGGSGATRVLNHTYQRVGHKLTPEEPVEYIAGVRARYRSPCSNASLTAEATPVTITVAATQTEPDDLRVRFTASPSSLDEGETVTFTPTVTYTAGNPDDQSLYDEDAVQYFWTFGDNNGSAATQSAKHLYQRAGEYIAQLRVTYRTPGGQYLVAYAEQPITVGEVTVDPDTFSVTMTASPQKIQTGQTVSFDSTVTYTAGDTALQAAYREEDVQLLWTVGDGGSSNEAAFTHTYQRPGVYDVQLRATYRAPSGQVLLAKGETLTITVEDPVYEPDTFDVEIDASTLTLMVDEYVDFRSVVTYTSEKPGYEDRFREDEVQLLWDFGDGQAADVTQLRYQYRLPGTYNVTLRAYYRDPDGRTILARATPIVVTVEAPMYDPLTFDVAFTATPGRVYAGEAVDFLAEVTYQSEDPGAAPFRADDVQLFWDFTDGAAANATSVRHIFTRPGEYPVTLRAYYKGLAARTEPVIIVVEALDSDPAVFDITVELSATDVLVDDPIDFIATPHYTPPATTGQGAETAFNPDAVEYYWEIGDAVPGNWHRFTHRYTRPGTYHVALKAYYDGMVARSEPIVVTVSDRVLDPEQFTVALTTDASVVNPGDTVHYNATITYTPSDSADADRYREDDVQLLWTLGDGAIETHRSFTHSYTKAGTYDVQLRAYYRTPGGQALVAKASPVSIVVGEIETDPEIFSVVVEGAGARGTTAEDTSPSRITVPQGTLVSFTSEAIYTPPVAGLKPFDAREVLYFWQFGDGMTAGNSPFATHIYEEPGVYTVTLRGVTRGLQSQSSLQVEVTQVIAPDLTFSVEGTVDATTGTTADIFTFTATPRVSDAPEGYVFDPSDVLYRWDFGDGYSGFEPTVLHQYEQKGDYLVTVTGYYRGLRATALPLRMRITVPDDAPPPGGEVAITVLQRCATTGDYCVLQASPRGIEGEDGEALTPEEIDLYRWMVDGRTVAFTRTFAYRFPEANKPYVVVAELLESGQTRRSAPETFTVQPLPAGSTRPVVDISADTETLLTGQTVTFFPQITGMQPGQLRFAWEDGKGSVGEKPHFETLYTTPGEYTVRLVTTLSDGDDTTEDPTMEALKVVQVYENSVRIVPSQPSATTDDTITLTAEVTGLPDGVDVDSDVLYRWRFGDDTAGFQRVVQKRFNANGEHLIELSVYYAGQTRTVRLPYTVGAGEFPSLEDDTTDGTDRVRIIPSATAVRVGDAIDFTVQFPEDLAEVNPETDVRYIWDFGDRQAVFTPTATHSYFTTGVYTVELTAVVQGLPYKAYTRITVVSEDSDPNLIMEGLGAPFGVTITEITRDQTTGAYRFSAESNYDAVAAVDYQWDFGDGFTAFDQATEHVFTPEGNYQVVVIARTQGQLQVASVTLSAMALPPTALVETGDLSAEIVVDENTDGTLTLRAEVTGTEGETVYYSWYFGDETSAFTPTVTHAYRGSGVYTLNLLVRNAGRETYASRTLLVSVPESFDASIGAVGVRSIFDDVVAELERICSDVTLSQCTDLTREMAQMRDQLRYTPDALCLEAIESIMTDPRNVADIDRLSVADRGNCIAFLPRMRERSLSLSTREQIDRTLTALRPVYGVVRTDRAALESAITELTALQKLAQNREMQLEFQTLQVKIQTYLGILTALSETDRAINNTAGENAPTIQGTVGSSFLLYGQVEGDAVDEADVQQAPRFTWDMGDGGVSIGKNINYQYTEPGLYEVRLSVMVGDRQAEDVLYIQVDEAPVGQTAPSATTPAEEKPLRPRRLDLLQ